MMNGFMQAEKQELFLKDCKGHIKKLNNSDALNGYTSIYRNSNESSYLVLDFGKEVTGYFYIEIETSSEDLIEIQYGPTRESIVFTKKVKPNISKGLFVDNQYIVGRYVKISVTSDAVIPTEVFISFKRVGLKFSAYPCIYRGNFLSDNELLNKIWKMGAYTLQLCMQKNVLSSEPYTDRLSSRQKKFINEWRNIYSDYTLVDGPRRDREVWIGDLRTEALTAYYAFDAANVVKSSLMIFYDLQKSSGVIPVSSGTWQNFEEYYLWWIISVWENYFYTGNKEFLKSIYPGIKSLLDWILFNCDERGFIYNSKSWMWTFPREGYSSATQCILYYALKCSIKIENTLGNKEAVSQLETLVNKIHKNINLEFWDDSKGVYIEKINSLKTQNPVFSDTNCYCVIFGIADDMKKVRVLSYLKNNMWTKYGSTTIDKKVEDIDVNSLTTQYAFWDRRNNSEDILDLMWPHNKQIWPFMNGYEVEANFLCGNIKAAFELIMNCWGNMANGETGTFWELVDAENGCFTTKSLYKYSKEDVMNSASHGWSGWITYIISSYILGVRVINPGFQKVLFSPNLGDLKWIEGSVPTPYGDIRICIKDVDDKYFVTIDKPNNIKIMLDERNELIMKAEIIINTSSDINE